MELRPIAVVVDDNKPFLMYLTRLLNRMNLEVLPVNTLAEALEISRVTRPHLMTMEMAMPDMDGLEALKAIRADEEIADLPVIMIANYQDKHRQWEALSLGCIDVLEKPLDLRRLHNAIQRCDLYPGGRRRYLRAPFERAVVLSCQGRDQQVQSLTLSERGIFVRLKAPLAKGAKVDIELPLPSGSLLRVGGSVIYAEAVTGDDSGAFSGAAVKFDRLTYKCCETLSALVAELLVGDLLPGSSDGGT